MTTGEKARYQRKSDQAKKALDRFIVRDDFGHVTHYQGRKAMHWYHAWNYWWSLSNGFLKPKRTAPATEIPF